jgi:hypothetical protein
MRHERLGLLEALATFIVAVTALLSGVGRTE